jgi:hypothetical protein
MRLSHLACAAVLAVSQIAGALAQGNLAPSVGADNQKEAADIKAGSGAHSTTGTAARSPTTPGGTGQTVVPGSNSTVAGDRASTAEARTGSGGSGGTK